MDDQIRHVVVLMLENNSFDRMLGSLQSKYPNLDGVDPNALPRTNPDYNNPTHLFGQLPTATNTVTTDLEHDLDDVIRQIDNQCQGFVANFAQHHPTAKYIPEKFQVMAYFKFGALPVLHALAQNFLVCDHWFSSLPGPTWPNRFFVHSGTSLGHTDMPNGIFDPAIHLYDQTTLYDLLERKGVDWKIYFGDIPQSLLMTHQLGYPTHYKHVEQFFQDAAGSEASFPEYSFIEPYYFGARQNDQHPPTDVLHGEALIATIYNAIRGNQALWESTLFVLLYDEHGGFYDHVVPLPTVAPDGHITEQFAFNQLGVRVPALLISPWLEAGVLKTTFDHTSLLKYATDKWGLGPLGNRTAQANTFAGLLRAAVRQDCPASIPIPALVDNPTDTPLNEQQAALAGFSQHLEVNVTKPTDQVIAAHATAMAGSPRDQGAAVAERVDNFLKKAVEAKTLGGAAQ